MKRALAATQTVPVRGDIDSNIKQHLYLVRAAAGEAIDIIVFPELSLTGYELDLADDLAFSEHDQRLTPLIEAASSGSVTLIVGAPLRIDAALYIGAFILKPDGNVDIYTKHHLGAFTPEDNPDGPVPPAEASVFRPGDRNPLVRLGDSTAAVAVCADIGHPAHAQAAADRGAGAYLAGMFVIPRYFAWETKNLASYAKQHAMAVVFANYGGPTGGLPSAGRSAIWSQTGELLAQLDEADAGVIIATKDERGWRAKTLTLDI